MTRFNRNPTISYSTTVEIDDVECEIDCTLEYEGECKGSWSEGQQMEPDDPSSASLLSAVDSDGRDVFKLLSADQVQGIENAALEDYESGCDDYDEGDYDD